MKIGPAVLELLLAAYVLAKESVEIPVETARFHSRSKLQKREQPRREIL